MKTKLYSCIRLLFVCVLFIPFLNNAKAQQVAKSFTAADGTFLGFYEFKPATYNDNPTKKYPLIIFLHGIGERGDGAFELPYLTWQGIPKLINEGATMTFTNPNTGVKETFLVLSPQLPKWKGAWENVYVDEMLKYAKANLRVDTNKMFLTGLSLGGGGVWSYANTSVAHASQFAAIAPICGVCYYNYGTLCTTIGTANIGVWGFTNADDNVVSPTCTIQAVDALSGCNPTKIKKTVYPWGGHDSWTKAYDTGHTIQTDINVYEWFLANSKPETNPAPNQPPVANAGSNVTITLPVNSVTLNGAASKDNDGTISSYVWSKVSGPASSAIANTTAVSTVVNSLIEGVYSFKLTVTDNKGASSSATVQVTVNAAPPPPPNQSPVANAGTAITITLPVSSATLNGSGSSDPDGTISTYLWSKLSGPASFSIANPAAANTSVTTLVEGVYSFKLQVTDNNGATASATVQVTVLPALPPANQNPVANAGAAVTINLPANAVTLNGSASSDPDGTIITYSWTKVSGPAASNIVNASSASTIVNSLTEGVYIFKLTVTDNQGASTSANVQVTVAAAPPPPNQPPVANAGQAVIITLPANSVTLNGAGSSDADGTISTYTWTKISGPTSFNIVNPSASTTAINNLVEGTYSFKLTVTDNNGASASATVQVTVNAAPPPANQAPVANAGNAITITLPVNSVNLNGSSSLDPDGSIASYSWTKVSGPAAFNIVSPAAANTAVSNLSEGVYSFKLTVTDNKGAASSASVQVTVNAAIPPANQPPVANAGSQVTITLPLNSVTLNGSASSDADGNIASYSWSKVSGPSSFVIVNASAASTVMNGLVEGMYTFKLTVTDNLGATSSSTVSVTVLPKPNTLPLANAGADKSAYFPAGVMTLDGSASYDPDGQIAAYSWKLVSGNGTITISNGNTAKPGILGMLIGEYVFELMVTDNSGGTATDQVKISIINGQNKRPKAHAGKDSSITLPASTSMLDGSLSSDPDGTISTYSWRKLSGPAGAIISAPSKAVTPVSQLVEGEYVFVLTVSDDKGLTSTDTVNLMVINNFRVTQYFTLYPNPARSILNVRYVFDKSGDVMMTIYNKEGTVVKTMKLEKKTMMMDMQIDVSNFKVGFYYVELKFDDGKSVIKQFLKR